ncbi:MAG: rhodanese-like domain-containing protein, partial [Candidatus Limnocylindrales bacterium]
PADRSDIGPDLVTDLARIGYDAVVGMLEGGIDAWRADGRPTAAMIMTSLTSVGARLGSPDRVRVLDVRQPTEWRIGIIPGSATIFLGDLPARIGELDPDATWLVVCRSGMRAAIGGSLLEAAGLRAEVVGTGGVPDWLAEHPTRDEVVRLR